MADHGAADLIYPLAKALKAAGLGDDVRKNIYRPVIEALSRKDYHDHPELFDLDDALQEVVAEYEGDRWAQYYTIDVSKVKPARRTSHYW
jgi:hypothetical protein